MLNADSHQMLCAYEQVEHIGVISDTVPLCYHITGIDREVLVMSLRFLAICFKNYYAKSRLIKHPDVWKAAKHAYALSSLHPMKAGLVGVCIRGLTHV